MVGKGRPQDPIWLEFDSTASGERCHHCLQFVSKKAERLKKHLSKCRSYKSSLIDHPVEESPEVQDLELEVKTAKLNEVQKFITVTS